MYVFIHILTYPMIHKLLSEFVMEVLKIAFLAVQEEDFSLLNGNA